MTRFAKLVRPACVKRRAVPEKALHRLAEACLRLYAATQRVDTGNASGALWWCARGVRSPGWRPTPATRDLACAQAAWLLANRQVLLRKYDWVLAMGREL